MGTHCVDRDLGSATLRSSQALENIGRHAFENGLDDATLRVTYALWRIGVLAADKGLGEPTEKIVLALQPIGIQSADKKFSSTLFRVVCALGAVGERAAEKGLDRVIMQVAETYRIWGTYPAIYGEYVIIDRMALDLGMIGLKATDKGLDITWLVAQVLGIIGECASDIELEDVLQVSVNSLREMGIHAIGGGRIQEHTFDSVVKALYRIGCRDFGKIEAAKHLAYFTSINKVRITKLMDDFKSELKPKEMVKFESLLDEVNAN